VRGPKRSHCPISLSLEVIGDRWSLLVLRDLIWHRKRRYGELLESTEAISTNILANRLAQLEECGLISRSVDAHNQVSYVPTEKGSDLLPVLGELTRWSLKYDPYARAPKPAPPEAYAPGSARPTVAAARRRAAAGHRTGAGIRG
jgi:DNA-binding HxlR family transcriptional regulator